MWAGACLRRRLQSVAFSVSVAVIGVGGLVAGGAEAKGITTSGPVPVAGSSVTKWASATDKSPSGAHCSDYMFKVSLSASEPKKYELFGRLCHQGAVNGRTLEILVAGGTYNHTYWDFPYEPNKYSYVRYATSAGYVTLDMDRLGYGYSSHVDPVGTTFERQGWVLHQVVQEIQDGELGARFYKIVLVAHSMGSFTAWNEAGTYHDVDGVIITGAEHAIGAVGAAEVAAIVNEPAQLDPKFAGKHLPVGYLTTWPGTRCTVVYHQGDVDPHVCAVDEQTKDTVNAGEIATYPTSVLDTSLSSSISVPVLMADGQYDQFYCLSSCSLPSVAAHEKAAYKDTPCYEAYYLPDAGHDIDLHLNSDLFYAKATQWLNSRIGSSSSGPATNACA